MVTLAFLEPGHFHAALTLRERHPAVSEEVYVYARSGPELESFLVLVQAFNARPERPTGWRLRVYRGEAPLERLLSERSAGNNVDAVVLAGRNDVKMEQIRRMHAAGLHVLADKPWLAGPGGLPELDAATEGKGALLMDIMTTRYDPAIILQRRLAAEPEVFGSFRTDDAAPAIEMDSLHTLFKLVNGKPLVRPAWYFDIRVQGDGLVDIPTHLADQVQQLLGGDADDAVPLDADRDVRLDYARRWATVVPAERYTQITGGAALPPGLARWVREGALHLLCNGELDYRLRGVPVHLRSVWVLEAPPGGGDAQSVRLRGTRADIEVDQDATTGFAPRVSVRPRGGSAEQAGVAKALRAAVARWQGDFPALAVAPAPDGALVLQVPPLPGATHEAQFAQVLDAFLAQLQAGRWPAAIAAALRCKYTLLARASERALAEA